jgi:hypothetical protein
MLFLGPSAKPGYFTNWCREIAKMGVPRAAQALAPRAGQPSRGTAGLDPRRT